MARTSKTKPVVIAEPKPLGRPTKYTPEIAGEIIEQLCHGEPLTKICATEGFPATRTVADWCAKYAAFSADFARARDIGYDAIADGAVRIADGEPGYSSNDVLRDRLRVETRLKLLAKWSKKYSDTASVQINDNRQQVVMVMPRTGGDRVIEADIIDALPAPEDAG